MNIRESPLMTSTHTWPVEITSLGDAVVGARVWSSQEQLRVTVVVKGTFAIVPRPGAYADRVAAAGPRRRAPGGPPERGLRAAGELALHVPQVDVWLTGHGARAAGHAHELAMARLGLARDGDAADQQGDPRAGGPVEERAEAMQFQHMPLVYERALGGRELGGEPGRRGPRGRADAEPARSPKGAPSPRASRPSRACWPARAGLLARLDLAALDALMPARSPRRFDWARTSRRRRPINGSTSLRGDE